MAKVSTSVGGPEAELAKVSTSVGGPGAELAVKDSTPEWVRRARQQLDSQGSVPLCGFQWALLTVTGYHSEQSQGLPCINWSV